MPKASTRNFGASWWAQRWQDLLDELGPEYESRLSRGRTYARNGSVHRPTVQPGVITAQVRGSSWELYRVRLELDTFTDAVWKRVIGELATGAFYAAKLLAGQMPAEIETVFAEAGVSLFPRTASEVRGACNCPDAEMPCKHICALHYTIATSLDTDPMLIFALRGRTGADVLRKIRARWSGASDAPTADAPTAEEMDDASPALQAARFFLADSALDTFIVHTEPPAAEAAILQRLGNPPFATAQEDIVGALIPIYTHISTRAQRAARHANKHPKGAAKRPSGPD